MTILSLALAQMEIGQIAIGAIANGFQLMHDFQTQLLASDCASILAQFSFDHQNAESQDLVSPFLSQFITRRTWPGS